MIKTWLVAASALAVLMAGCSPKLEEAYKPSKEGRHLHHPAHQDHR